MRRVHLCRIDYYRLLYYLWLLLSNRKLLVYVVTLSLDSKLLPSPLPILTVRIVHLKSSKYQRETICALSKGPHPLLRWDGHSRNAWSIKIGHEREHTLNAFREIMINQNQKLQDFLYSDAEHQTSFDFSWFSRLAFTAAAAALIANMLAGG